MNVLKECVGFARALNPGIGTELQTNGLFDEPEDARWIARNINMVWFSLDGPPEVNDRHRPDALGHGRTKEIESNLGEVAEGAAVGIRCTIVEETVSNQAAIVEYYYELGVEDLAFNPVIRPICRNVRGTQEVTRISIMEFARGFVDAHRRAEELGMRLSSALTFNFDEPTIIACRSCIPMPQLNPDGSVASCDMALYRDTMSSLRSFVYGQWDAEEKLIYYDGERIGGLRKRNLRNLADCSGCEVAQFCAGGCAGRVAYQTGSMYAVIPEYCEAIRYLGKHIELGRRVVEHTHP